MGNTAPSAGENIAVLRKARGLSQAKLAREVGITLSYLSKIETGLRPATPPVVAAVARVLHVTTARVYGNPFVGPAEQMDLLNELRNTVRRHTLPRESPLSPAETTGAVQTAADLRASTQYLELLRMLPALLGQTTASALDSRGEATAWGYVADVYSCAYTVAHRLAQPDLADMIVSRQMWAAQQTWNPSAEAAAAWNEAGTYQSAGQYEDGLAIIERAISRYEAVPASGPFRTIHLGSLHLRGVVLASRAKDANATRDHLRHAWTLAETLPDGRDLVQHHLTFGRGNTALYELASHVELDAPDRAVQMSGSLIASPPAGLKPNRLGRLYIDVARARLAVRDYAGAEEALNAAHAVAPQMAQIHPMGREVLRVLIVMHQRSKPGLLAMAKRAGLAS
ncbi:helix-turn-helix domain-containing protein [Kitasatospora sp. NPDC059817]|uniref:helix-turn-helix domain-containing protein n=1 Tax=Kitasatospora sp. NPDC059817 TaxID=3346961 RepID=UPI00364B3D05